MDKQELVRSLIEFDNDRARSKQTAIGVSQLGGCRRQVWHKLQGDQGSNTTLRLASIMGTAIHSQIEKVIQNDDGRYLIEHRVEIDDLPPATIDLFDTANCEVIDWKTITIKNIPYFVSKQKRWQVQTYGYLMTQAGYEVKQVTLIGIPRDGNENDIVVHTEPYDRGIALEALQWLEDVKSLENAPEPERDAVSFCKNYCEFYGSQCGGRGKDLAGEPITDEVASQAALKYKEILNAEKELQAEKDAAKLALEGISGITFDGVKVAWSETKGRETPDMDEIQKILGSEPIPVKIGMPSLRLSVK
jgi:hypothetical protein